MAETKLILINGFMASGKTTIARKYISEHDLAMVIEPDSLVDNIGGWMAHREEVRTLAFELTKALIHTYLPTGHDVLLAYFVTNASEAEQFESIAREFNAKYYEVVLYNDRPDAISRLLNRGKWGMMSSPTITDKDHSRIEQDFESMLDALEKRPNAIKIQLKGKGPEATYRQFLQVVEQ